jgi:recombination protein RecT
VFPGGAIDPADASPLAHGLSSRRCTQPEEGLTWALAAMRESLEEVGVLLARHRDGRWASQDDVAGFDRQADFYAQVQQRGLVLAGADVFVLARWITDRDLGKRFDVPFLVARMPEGQNPEADNSEQFEPVWVGPSQALTEHEAGRFFMIFPTVRTLQRLKGFTGVQSVLDACIGEAPLWTSCPRAGLLNGQESRHMESDLPCGELALVCPDGHIAHPLDWDPTRAVPLLRHVQRLTCGNPGTMTGPGTNSYIVGDTRSGHVVIDPGPVDAAHTERLWAAAGADIRAIVCTHSHPDHSPGARPLQALCEARTGTRPPVLGLRHGPCARADSKFEPDRELQNRELISLGGEAPDGKNSSETHTLMVVHTPGHAANHLCLLLLEDGLLFSGDHILNGSTTVIAPPDGHMGQYLGSLDLLAQLCSEHRVEFILPAHGYAMEEAGQVIARLKAHRLQREAKVLAALRALPDGTPADWVQHAYADVPPGLWPVAQGSLMAHVEHLRETGQDRLP